MAVARARAARKERRGAITGGGGGGGEGPERKAGPWSEPWPGSWRASRPWAWPGSPVQARAGWPAPGDADADPRQGFRREQQGPAPDDADADRRQAYRRAQQGPALDDADADRRQAYRRAQPALALDDADADPRPTRPRRRTPGHRRPRRSAAPPAGRRAPPPSPDGRRRWSGRWGHSRRAPPRRPARRPTPAIRSERKERSWGCRRRRFSSLQARRLQDSRAVHLGPRLALIAGIRHGGAQLGGGHLRLVLDDGSAGLERHGGLGHSALLPQRLLDVPTATLARHPGDL
jgi:hypothetical protein